MKILNNIILKYVLNKIYKYENSTILILGKSGLFEEVTYFSKDINISKSVIKAALS